MEKTLLFKLSMSKVLGYRRLLQSKIRHISCFGGLCFLSTSLPFPLQQYKRYSQNGSTGCPRHRDPGACAGCRVGVKDGFMNLRRKGKGWQQGTEADLHARSLKGLIWLPDNKGVKVCIGSGPLEIVQKIKFYIQLSIDENYGPTKIIWKYYGTRQIKHIIIKRKSLTARRY